MINQIMQTRHAGLPQTVVFDQPTDGPEIQAKAFKQTNEWRLHDSGGMGEPALEASADDTA
jgi:hypothetical protein